MGLAKALLEKVEAEARTRNVRRVVLRTEVENLRAINLYKNYGYAVNHRMPPLKLRAGNSIFCR
jgi:ribosomal protein S18 acetylase RimI-like enzyme